MRTHIGAAKLLLGLCGRTSMKVVIDCPLNLPTTAHYCNSTFQHCDLFKVLHFLQIIQPKVKNGKVEFCCQPYHAQKCFISNILEMIVKMKCDRRKLRYTAYWGVVQSIDFRQSLDFCFDTWTFHCSSKAASGRNYHFWFCSLVIVDYIDYWPTDAGIN